MIKYLLAINLIVYISIAWAWYCIFTYQFTLKINSKTNKDMEPKDLKGFRLLIICLCWIFTIPITIKQTKKNNEEE
jgi:hypothetical protein